MHDTNTHLTHVSHTQTHISHVHTHTHKHFNPDSAQRSRSESQRPCMSSEPGVHCSLDQPHQGTGLRTGALSCSSPETSVTTRQALLQWSLPSNIWIIIQWHDALFNSRHEICMTSNASLFDLQITKLMLALRKLTRFTNLKGGGMFRSKKKKKNCLQSSACTR